MSSEASKIVSDLHNLARRGEDISAISCAVDHIKRDQRGRIISNLKGLADFAIMAKPKGSRFILAYFKDGEAKTLEGIDYAKGKYISKDEEDKEVRVYLRGDDYPVSNPYQSMDGLEKTLEIRDIPYYIAYFD